MYTNVLLPNNYRRKYNNATNWYENYYLISKNDK